MATIKGGNKFEAALKDLINKLATPPASVEVGFMSDATYPDGTSVAMVAAMNEFGTSKSPPRPFFRNMVADKSPGWPDDLAKILKTQNGDIDKTLALMGEKVADDLRESIIKLSDPALSPVTIMMRGMRSQGRYKDTPFWALYAEASRRVAQGKTSYSGSSKPLIDTGIMLGSVTYKLNSSE